MDIRHIKITTSDGLFRINEKKAFKGLVVSLIQKSDPEKKPSCFSSLFWLVYWLSHPGVDSVLPAELSEGVLQGGGHHAVHTFQAIGEKQLYEHHAQHHSKYSAPLIAENRGESQALNSNLKRIVHGFFTILLLLVWCGLTGGSVKGVGIARARYDFSARDRSELSLQEGDTIKILSKKGHSGWWKGEVYGRVSAFTHIQVWTRWITRLASFYWAAPVGRWDCFQPTMWRRTSPNTADVATCVDTT